MNYFAEVELDAEDLEFLLEMRDCAYATPDDLMLNSSDIVDGEVNHYDTEIEVFTEGVGWEYV